MIEKIKTITYQTRSHGHRTILSEKGIVQGLFCVEEIGFDEVNRATVKKLIWHLQDVLKCMNTIKKEEAEKKMKNSQDNIPKP